MTRTSAQPDQGRAQQGRPSVVGDPVADPQAVITGATYRITVLTEGLVRLEHASDGVFEDRPSAFAVNRRLPVPQFRVSETDAGLEVVTDRFALSYDRGPFTTSGLSVSVRGGVSSWHSVWRYGTPEPVGYADLFGGGNLGGTARTLDEADGAIDLEPGIASRHGFALLDDSASLLFTDDGWVAPRRPTPDAADGPAGPAAGPTARQDLYVFAYGRDYAAALQAFYAVSGRQPLLPRWALGNWWSRYHPYTAAEYGQLLDRFAEAGLPFSVAVLDMDWHLVDDVDARFGSGWTGYTWNKGLFPDPAALAADLHARGLRLTLNDHPADGVRAFEDAYPAMADAMGLSEADQAAEVPIAFDVTDRTFVENWLRLVRRPLEDDGVDFWWMDWQQGRTSRVTGIDPLWVLNHVGYLDNAVGGRRPLGFSRYAGPGSHRYPVGFSGDTVISWASLAFQPEFTATAANIGYGWWSHDVGGHMFGERDDDLATRWVQLGVFSPILRLHSTLSPFMGKEPWNFPAQARSVMEHALRLRHRLLPYLHTMNHRAAGLTDGGAVPLVTPMYHLHPWAQEAYAARTQFAFGSQLLVAPITSPTDPVTLTGSVTAWLPPGTWVDVLDGLVYDGDREVVLHRPLDAVPVLAAPGAIVPLDAAAVPAGDAGNPDSLEVLVVVGADGSFALVEDDGAADLAVVTTPVTFDQAAGVVTIGPAVGPAADVVPAGRSWTLTLVACEVGGGVTATVDGVAVEAVVECGPRRTSVRVDDVPVGARLRIELGADPQLAPNDLDERLFALLARAQAAYPAKERALAAATSSAPLSVRLSRLHALGLPRALETALDELLLARA